MESWSDYVRGEWWVDDRGYAEFCDANVSDQGHEAVAERHILGDHADDLWEALEEWNKENPEDKVKLADREYDEGSAIHEQYHDGGIPNEVGEKVMGAEKWKLLKDDSRTAYMKYYGVIRVINLNFGVWKLEDKHLKIIQNFLSEEAQGEFDDPETELLLEEASTGKYMEMPVQYFMALDRVRHFWGYQKESVMEEKKSHKLLHALDDLVTPHPEGKAAEMKPSDFDQKQIVMGMAAEMEHTDDPLEAVATRWIICLKIPPTTLSLLRWRCLKRSMSLVFRGNA